MIYKRLYERFPIRRHLVDHRFIEVDGPILIDGTFAMGERMTKKDPPRNGQLFVKFSVECSHSNSACQIVLRNGLPLPPKHVPRKLIQHDNAGQRALALLAPVLPPSLPNRRMYVFKSVFDL